MLHMACVGGDADIVAICYSPMETTIRYLCRAPVYVIDGSMTAMTLRDRRQMDHDEDEPTCHHAHEETRRASPRVQLNPLPFTYNSIWFHPRAESREGIQ